MKNSKPFDGDAFAFYKLVCSKKQNVGLLSRLMSIDDAIRRHFDDYDQHFRDNSLELLVANGYIDPQKADLKELYDYDSAILQKLRDQLTTTDHGRVVKCQNCTINDIDTFDHFVPQGEFAEFIVHPRNLLCCCGDCNSRRSNIWRSGGRRSTLNLYLDTLPAVQYLFVTADVGNKAIETSFYLENRDGIDPNLFALIEGHYSRLNLFRRYSDGADTLISSFKNIMEPLRAIRNLAETRRIVLESIRRDQISFGMNYWQSILKLELLNSDDFMIDYE